jgi:hypothetical protein
MTQEESAIMDFVNGRPETSFARKEIARKAVRRSDYELNQHWANQPLSALVARGLLEMDDSGFYRLPQANSGKPD